MGCGSSFPKIGPNGIEFPKKSNQKPSQSKNPVERAVDRQVRRIERKVENNNRKVQNRDRIMDNAIDRQIRKGERKVQTETRKAMKGKNNNSSSNGGYKGPQKKADQKGSKSDEKKDFKAKVPTKIPLNPNFEKWAIEKDERSCLNSTYVTWVHGADWDPDMIGQPTTQPCPGSKQHLPWAFVKVPNIPESVEDFIKLREKYGADSGPETAAALFIVAMNVYVRNKDLGKQCLIVACHADCLKPAGKTDTKGVYKGKKLFGQQPEMLMKAMDKKPRIAPALFFGSYETDNYDISKLPGLYVKISDRFMAETKGDYCNRTIWQTARRSSVSMGLRRNTRGVWKVSRMDAMLTPPPAAPILDDGDDI
mmetsp:Transcript_2131/g.3074  ORF Transcript_2131/g.3074 Transcript_2131/m.3074 type:complete len:365 (+) Transcript_2131:193-1287(+)